MVADRSALTEPGIFGNCDVDDGRFNAAGAPDGIGKVSHKTGFESRSGVLGTNLTWMRRFASGS